MDTTPKRPRGADVDAVVGVARDQRRADDPRRQTNPGGVMAVKLPGAPTLPLEHSETIPARAHAYPTQRATPAGGLVAQTPDGASLEALRRRAEAAEDRAAELERRERVRAETDSPAASFPPPVQRSPSPIPSSTAKADQAIGLTVRVVIGKLAPYLVAAAGVGGGATAVLKPSAEPSKVEAILAKLEDVERNQARLEAKANGLLDREPQLTEFVECLYEQQADYFEQLLPSQQRLVTGSLQRTWVDRCRNRRPKR